MSGFAVSYVAGGRFDPPFMPTKRFPFIEGIRIEMSSSEPVVVHKYTVPQDAELISIAMAASRYYDTDYWGVKVNGKVLAKSIYTKDLPEGLYLMVVVPLKAGDEIELTYTNASQTGKAVWFNYQMLV
ncbi:hypothetical protein GFC29_3809 (plasmid) [Anoxybacillus sp. B7M1]|uniref:hypothetical protein n=1 Tax=Anoxybacillus sp. B7M1 TaxID=1490057 RepID=UPI000698C9CE|nr:hypothetical protein [Anoxybacillus sp. B7M1]ANB66132.1 hypothetical protein GFC29_3809 [Anoxybacillus sp. B7M1]